MPLVRIDLNRGRNAFEVASHADAIHDAIVETYGTPPIRDRFQIVTQHEAGAIIGSFGFRVAQYSTGVIVVPAS